MPWITSPCFLESSFRIEFLELDVWETSLDFPEAELEPEFLEPETSLDGPDPETSCGGAGTFLFIHQKFWGVYLVFVFLRFCFFSRK